MARTKLPLSKAKVKQVRLATLDEMEKELPKRSKALDEVKATPKLETERAKQLFHLLLASDADKAKLASPFFENLPKRLFSVEERMNLSPQGDLHFPNWEACAAYVEGKVLRIGLRTSDVGEFTDDMKGRKWWFMGEILWERYIKYGPVRKFLDQTAQDALRSINDEIRDNNPYKMADMRYGLPVKKGDKPIELISITKPFGKLSAGVEFLLETADGEKKYLDFGHIAFNDDGYWIIPTPTEIKMPSAAGQVAQQFSQFMPRFRDANTLIVTFEEADLEKLKGPGIVKLTTKIIDGRTLIDAELDRSKMVFDPFARNQMVVRPHSETWGIVNKAARSPNIDIGVGTTAKDIDVLKPFEKEGFNFWKIQVDVSRTPFEQLYEAIFLGKK